ncbi:hypothetical protein GPECTOR_8g386 [Gonium pectorale]|uniref:Fucosyltransferase n=1 Tax=Gonium pectorale TaxID=33097 RepID=A0A150GTL5_GONPE|nr:hypothetical protein GPECTOR_8g386 [Gonium pectorale]|eukprot:KXZ53018.1 hypothetical protein GPECTOR_8g386 [Gonium pectorale]
MFFAAPCNDFEGEQPNCTIGKTVIKCRYGAGINADTADALWYHIPSMGGSSGVRRHHPKQLLIGMSMESSEYYPALDNKNFMKAFDIESTYRTCSQVPVFYFDYNEKQIASLFKAPKPFERKKTALVYVNSNCGAKSGRSDIMRRVIAMNHSTIPTHSWGNCDRNMHVSGSFDKVKLIEDYKFCVAMENSITKDYITEKLWQELERLNSNRTAYEAKLAWKTRKWEQLAPDFLAMTERSHVRQPHSRCQLCRIALRNRYHPQNYTTCLFNKTWTADYHVKA